MNLTITPQAKADLDAGVRVKFVIIGPRRSPDPEEAVCLIFDAEELHAATAKTLLAKHEDFVPVGGGKIEGSDTWWDSPSFRDEFGYDQPEGRMSGEMLLQALEELLESEKSSEA